MNILKTEYFQQSAGSTQTGTGELELRNGVWAMRVHPAPFWGGSGDYGNPNFKGALRGHFSSNTQYVFNLWVDADNSYYDAQSINVPGGFYIVYTDSTSEAWVWSGNIKNPVGWQHSSFISKPNKTIDALNIYYYTSTPVYYRYDSYIIPVTNSNINKNGIINTGTISEGYTSNNTAFQVSGIVTNNCIEY